ncbi:MAG: hypothetical protein GY836_09075, partial [Herbaspirillum sp.]|uniref:hypothetical protein n=1 Tax=Herbaspirillum sp. TaxID=1890675 RepID=UPI0025840AE8
DVTVFDVSNADFTIMPGFEVTAPNGSEVWTVDGSEDITWITTGDCSNVKLEYSVNSGSDYTNIIASTANTQIYAWTIPDNISTTCKVRISDVLNPTAIDATDGLFKIRGALEVTAPDGAESWNVADEENITWTRTGTIDFIKLEYSTDSGVTYPGGAQLIIASTDASTGTYAWTIPDDLSTTIRVKASDTSDSTVYDESDANFTIKGALTVDSPNGTEDWIVGTSEDITWTRFGSIANVKLEYSTTGGAPYPNEIIAATDASTETYAWAIPDAIGTTLKVKVTDVDNSLVYDESDASFYIKGALVLDAPDGGQVWFVGNSEDITWTRTGSISTVKLEYSD